MSTLTNPTNLQWANAGRTVITMMVTHNTYGDIPFSASPDDTEAHGRELFERAAAGEFGEIAEFVAPVKTWAVHQADAKSELAKSDLVAMRCWKACAEYPASWLARDVALRAIVSALTGDPSSTPIPDAPAFHTGT